jgi:S-disulfanyl-L-cysteine oxidoreductase SoxD
MALSPTRSRRSAQSSTCTATSLVRGAGTSDSRARPLSAKTRRPIGSTTTGAISIALTVVVVVLVQYGVAAQSPVPSGLGRAPTAAELRAWDLSVGPEGAELPPGSGSATQGALVFTQRGCAACHGPTGVEGPGPELIGGKATLATNYFPIRFWPFAPPVWDYIKRAMPYDRPGQLTNDEVYALTAFLLYKNEITKEGDIMDAKTLPKVQMPHRADYKGPSPANWTPDTPRGFKSPS